MSDDNEYDYDKEANGNSDVEYDILTKGGEEVFVKGQPLKPAQTQEGFG